MGKKEEFETYCRMILTPDSVEKNLNGQFGETLKIFGDYLKSTPPSEREFSIFVPVLDENGTQKRFEMDGELCGCTEDIYFALRNENLDMKEYAPFQIVLYHSGNRYGRPPTTRKIPDAAECPAE